MNRSTPYWLITICLTAAFLPSHAFGQFGKSKSKAKVSLLSSVEAVVPGKSFDMGVRFELDDGWHIYWVNSGESGLPPRVNWKLPQGITAEELRFPVPDRHVDAGGITTNIHEFAPMLLATMTPSPEVTGKSIEIEADVAYLICREMCLRETATVSLSLPIRPGTEPKPANDQLFAQARRALPTATSKILRITPSVKEESFAPGTKFDLTLTIDIGKGFHIQSHKPLMDAFVPTEVFMKPTEGLTFGQALYPKPHIRKLPVLGEISEYSGKINVRVPVTVEDEPPSKPVRLAGILKHQGCNDKGTCFPPTAVRFTLTAGQASAAAQPQTKVAAASPSDPDSTIAESTEEAGTSDQPNSADLADKTAQPSEKSAANEGSPFESFDAFLAYFGVPGLMVVCFLYGLFINATPCVLPLLSIKVLGFVQQAHESRGKTLVLGLSFGAGVMLFFVILGLLASRGANIFHYPVAIVALGAVVMAMALSMLGVYTLQVPTSATNLEAQIKHEGMVASFSKGALAPVLGFACTGPLLAGAFGVATKQPPNIAILAFLVMGIGMASPYMLLGANPNWLGFLPKPGNWMITFERIMGFLLLGMVIWLIHPIVSHLGSTGLEWTYVFLVAVALACWTLGKVNFAMSGPTRFKYRSAAAAIVIISGGVIYTWLAPIHAGAHSTIVLQNQSDWSDGIPWRKWPPETVEEVVQSGRPVFVDFTAAYCTVCKANKAIATNTEEVRKRMRECGVVPFQGDYTAGDPKIFEMLQAHDRAGVPLNLIYPAGKPDEPILLETNLTKSYLLAKLDEVCPGEVASSGAPK